MPAPPAPPPLTPRGRPPNRLVVQEPGGRAAEAQRLWRDARRHRLSVRSLYKQARTCSRRDLQAARRDLLPYRAQGTVASIPGRPERAAAWCPLVEVVHSLHALHRLGPLFAAVRPWWVVICVDGTNVWQAQATRGDVWLHTPDGHLSPTCPASWASWFAMDGRDDTAGLLAMDAAADLNGSIRHLQDHVLLPDSMGGSQGCLCFLTGDGKAMAGMHAAPGKGWWLCEEAVHSPEALQVQADITAHSRYDSFLPAIPRNRRIGDVVHCAGRIANTVLKRLATQAASSQCPSLVAGVRQFVQDVQWSVQGLPAAQRLAPRPTTLGTLDLTASRLLLEDIPLQDQLVALVQQKFPNTQIAFPGGRGILVHAVLRTLLRGFRTLHQFWHQPADLSEAQLQDYERALGTCRQCWQALQWRPTVWVHWVMAHSLFFLRTFGNLAMFSSMPTERRHQQFKRDLRHSFHGWKLVNPRSGTSALTHVLEMDALDKGLRLHGPDAGKRQRLA